MAHWSCPVLGPNGQACMALPFQGVGRPGQAVPHLRTLSAAGWSQERPPALHQGGAGWCGSVFSACSNIQEALSVYQACAGAGSHLWYHTILTALWDRGGVWHFTHEETWLVFVFPDENPAWGNIAQVANYLERLPAYVQEQRQLFTGEGQKFRRCSAFNFLLYPRVITCFSLLSFPLSFQFISFKRCVSWNKTSES